jgi:hypothetical protein
MVSTLTIRSSALSASLGVRRYVASTTDEDRAAARQRLDDSAAQIEEMLPALVENSNAAEREVLETFEQNFNQALPLFEDVFSLADAIGMAANGGRGDGHGRHRPP